MRKRVSVSAELCASPGVAIALRFRDISIVCYEPRVADYRAAKSWEISPRAARSCHFSPSSPFLPPSFPSARSPSLFASCGVFCRVYNRLYATATRFYRVIVAGFYRVFGGRGPRSSVYPRPSGKAPSSGCNAERRRSSVGGGGRGEEGRGGRRRWLDIVERAREGDQQRIRLTGHGRPRQNVSMSFPHFAFFISLCVAKSLAEKDTLVRAIEPELLSRYRLLGCFLIDINNQCHHSHIH